MKLFRESDNEHDVWAVAIYTDDEMVGYISRYKNQTIDRLMDAGKRFNARIEVHFIAERKKESIIESPLINRPSNINIRSAKEYDFSHAKKSTHAGGYSEVSSNLSETVNEYMAQIMS